MPSAESAGSPDTYWVTNTASGFAATVPGPAYEMDFPVVVYEISQENTSITFYRSAGWDEVEGMPSGELRGVMLFQRARRLTDAVDAVSQV